MRLDPPAPPLVATLTAAGMLPPHFYVGFTRKLRPFAGKAVDITVALHATNRSARANRYYWGVVVALATDHNGDTPEDFHDEMCARFLSRRRITIVDTATGEAVEVAVPRRSSGLSIGDFYRFVEQVRQFCAEFLGVETPDPDPSYWRTAPPEDSHATV